MVKAVIDKNATSTKITGLNADTVYYVTGLAPDTTYYFQVRSYWNAGFVGTFTYLNSSLWSSSIKVTTRSALWIDLDIDSFNTSRFAMPSRTQAEDDIENDLNHFGKIIRPNYGDINNNKILDLWDGYNGGGMINSGPNCSEKFVPIVIEIPDWIVLANATFQFDYWLGSLTPTAGTSNPPNQYGNGNIRIWNKDGNLPRSGNNISSYGNLVMNGSYYTAAQLGFTDTNREITLYVEGHSLGSNVIIVAMDYNHNGQMIHVEDAVKYTVIEFGFTPYTPETKYIAPMPIPEANWTEMAWAYGAMVIMTMGNHHLIGRMERHPPTKMISSN